MNNLRKSADTYTMADERAARRAPFVCRAQITWAEGGKANQLSGMIENRSASGLGIHVAKAIPAGTALTVQFHNESHAVIVKRCMKERFGFFVGVAFCPADPGRGKGQTAA